MMDGSAGRRLLAGLMDDGWMDEYGMDSRMDGGVAEC